LGFTDLGCDRKGPFVMCSEKYAEDSVTETCLIAKIDRIYNSALITVSNGCYDTDNGAKDIQDGTCASYYNEYPEACGYYDDADFQANTMCCNCKGLGDYRTMEPEAKTERTSDDRYSDHSTDIDGCDPNPCKNGATCIHGDYYPTCYCMPGFTGDNCDIEHQKCREDGDCGNSNRPFCGEYGICVECKNDFDCHELYDKDDKTWCSVDGICFDCEKEAEKCIATCPRGVPMCKELGKRFDGCMSTCPPCAKEFFASFYGCSL